MRASAQELGFRFSEADLYAKLPIHINTRELTRVRVELFATGGLVVVGTPFDQVADNQNTWTVATAKSCLASGDPLGQHRTSRRSIHEAARAEFAQEAADEVILFNERDELCEGTMTNVFIKGPDDVLLTPPLACGIAPGILRQELIDRCKAREQILKRESLTNAAQLFVGSSLYGLIPAKLVSVS